MRKVTFYFLIVEALDILTTVIGLSLGLKEGNLLLPIIGWGWLVFFKALSIIIVVIGLEKKKPQKYDILIILVIVPFVIWNIINIVSIIIYP